MEEFNFGPHHYKKLTLHKSQFSQRMTQYARKHWGGGAEYKTDLCTTNSFFLNVFDTTCIYNETRGKSAYLNKVSYLHGLLTLEQHIWNRNKRALRSIW